MIEAIFAPFPLPFIFLSHSPVILIITVREMIQNSIKTKPLIYLSFYDTEMPPHSPLCGGGSEKNAAHRSCNSEAALNLISETIGSQNILNSCPLSSQSVQGNICFTKSAGSVQYLLHPPCGVLYNLISFLLKASFLQRTLFLFWRRRCFDEIFVRMTNWNRAVPDATRSIIYLGIRLSAR